jgi:hypothetical protein
VSWLPGTRFALHTRLSIGMIFVAGVKDPQRSNRLVDVRKSQPPGREVEDGYVLISQLHVRGRGNKTFG